MTILNLCVLLGAFLIEGCSGQMPVCDATLTVSSFTENPIEPGVRTCIQCVIGGSVSTTATWLIGTTPGASATTPIDSSDGEVVNGALVIFDPSTIIPGPGNANAIRVACSAGGTSLNFFILLDTFLPPVVSDVTVNETDVLFLVCIDNNVAGRASVRWENSEGEVLVKSSSFSVSNVLRNYTGVYTCVLTRNDNNETLSADAMVTVQYAPELSTDEETTQLAPLNGILMLSCDFDGVPTPTIEWLHENDVLSNSDSDVIITTDEDSSLLVVTNLQRDDMGQYTCCGTNIVGVDTRMIQITIVVPPSPATNLRVVNVGEFEISLEWNNSFNGFSPITGVQFEIFEGRQLVDTRDLPGTSDLETTVLAELTPLGDYTFVLRVRNVIGLSDPVSVDGSTLSLMLAVPTITSFVALSSTQLQLTWMPPASIDTTDDADSWTVSYTRVGDSGSIILTVFTTSTTIVDLDKGTSYTATVTGNNVRGPGDTSDPMTAQTDVDPPSAPEGFSVDGVAASALKISWMPPSDNGGRPISEYQLFISEDGFVFTLLTSSIDSNDRSYLYRSNSELFDLDENTTYWVRLVAVNTEPLIGAAAIQSGTTQSILQPQLIFDEPIAPEVSNITSFITWPHPGGDVINFIIEYKLTSETWTDSANVMRVSVPGDRLNTTLDDLEPAFTYDVRILVSNSLGMSEVSPVLSFSTAPPPAPEISSSSNSTTTSAGQTVVLTCITDVSPTRIAWSKDGGSPLLTGQTVLTLDDVQPEDSGSYVCSVIGLSVSSPGYDLLVPEPRSGPVCDGTLTVSRLSVNPIEPGVRTCIQCAIGGSVSTTATWLIGTATGDLAPIDPSDGEVVNGVLVIFDPSTIIPGPGNTNAIRVACSTYNDILVFVIVMDAGDINIAAIVLGVIVTVLVLVVSLLVVFILLVMCIFRRRCFGRDSFNFRLSGKDNQPCNLVASNTAPSSPVDLRELESVEYEEIPYKPSATTENFDLATNVAYGPVKK